MRNIVQRPSPNYDDRGDVPIDILLLHYTGMPDAAGALERMCDPDASVSAHYMVDEDGAITQMVEEEKRAWHAGASYWAGETNINARSIGIEIVNPGHEWGYTDFPEAQIDAVITLSQGILGRHPIPPFRVLGHSDVAPDRKEDPGEKFPWDRLAREGVGLWPERTHQNTNLPAMELPVLRREFVRFGYDAAGGNTFDGKLSKIIIAFQRHYAPDYLLQPFDGEQAQIIRALNNAKS